MNTPNWTDIFQAIAAIIAVPLTLGTLLKLVLKDKKNISLATKSFINYLEHRHTKPEL